LYNYGTVHGAKNIKNIAVISLALLNALHMCDVTSYDNSSSTTYAVKTIIPETYAVKTIIPETNRCN
jgi:hypothetical protein